MKYLALVFFMFGCSSAVVSRQYEPDRAVVVAYLNQGMSFVTDARRNDAFSQANSFCGSTAKLMSESSQGQFAGFNGSFAVYSNYVYMLFHCI